MRTSLAPQFLLISWANITDLMLLSVNRSKRATVGCRTLALALALLTTPSGADLPRSGMRARRPLWDRTRSEPTRGNLTKACEVVNPGRSARVDLAGTTR